MTVVTRVAGTEGTVIDDRDVCARAAAAGDAAAWDRLYRLAYDTLLRAAGRMMARQRRGHTFSANPEALVHESFVKLAVSESATWNDYSHFLAVAITAMQQYLADHAAGKAAQKRGGDWQRRRLTGLGLARSAPDLSLVDLRDAVARYRTIEPRGALVVDLRFFAGLSTRDVADVLGVSTRTVEKEWAIAKGWLRARISR